MRENAKALLDEDIDQPYAGEMYQFAIEQITEQCNFAEESIAVKHFFYAQQILMNSRELLKIIKKTKGNQSLFARVHVNLISCNLLANDLYRAIKLCQKAVMYAQVETEAYQVQIQQKLAAENLQIRWKEKELIYERGEGAITFCGFGLLKQVISSSDREELIKRFAAKLCAYCLVICSVPKHKSSGFHCNAPLARNKKCGNCKTAYYCSRSHQKKDWKGKHKSICVFKKK